jgi:hypothetical protein
MEKGIPSSRAIWVERIVILGGCSLFFTGSSKFGGLRAGNDTCYSRVAAPTLRHCVFPDNCMVSLLSCLDA